LPRRRVGFRSAAIDATVLPGLDREFLIALVMKRAGRFQDDPRIEPMSHRTERASRPAVIGRKLLSWRKKVSCSGAVEAGTRVVRRLPRSTTDLVLLDTMVHPSYTPSAQPSRARHVIANHSRSFDPIAWMDRLVDRLR
jgi:hypothetical protein